MVGSSGGRIKSVADPDPDAFAHCTVIVFPAFERATELVVVDVDTELTPVVTFATTQLVPLGITVLPLTV
jgi:hypothetical protein